MKQKNLMMIILLSLLVTCFCAFILRAQEKPQEQKKQEIPKPAYQVEVVVTNVSVVVTDKDGRRITDLKPENFEIFEDGRRQTLTNFFECVEYTTWFC